MLQAKHPQHAKKPSIVSELGADLDRPSADELAREVYNYTGETGTYRYMAPEVFRHEPYNAKVRFMHHPPRLITYQRGGSAHAVLESAVQMLTWRKSNIQTAFCCDLNGVCLPRDTKAYAAS